MSLVLKAIKFAIAKHHGQVRRGSGLDYVTHTIAVSYILIAFKRSKHAEELLAAAILHDTFEDTDTTFIELVTEFTPLVASLVLEMSNDEEQIKLVGKLEYHKKKLVGMSSYGLVLKLADRLNNVSDNPSEKMIKETIELMEHLKANRRLSGTQLKMVEEILKICNGV